MTRLGFLAVTCTVLCACSNTTEVDSMQISGVVNEINAAARIIQIDITDPSSTELAIGSTVRLVLTDDAEIAISGTIAGTTDLDDLQVGSHVDVWLTSAAISMSDPATAEAWKVVAIPGD